MTLRFNYSQRQQLKQLFLECEVQRFTTEESLAFIKVIIKTEISAEYFHIIKRNLRDSVGARLDELRKHRTAFLSRIFRRTDEIEKLQREHLVLYHKNANNPYLQKELTKELHQLTITLAKLIMKSCFQNII